MPTSVAPSTIDAAELRHFDAAADIWWDENGIAKWIHALTPLRVTYVADMIGRTRHRTGNDRLDDVTVLDVGCGAGVMAEPLAQRGATVLGIDPAPALIDVATRHAREARLPVDYRCTTTEALAEEGARFDVVLAFDVAEHVSDSRLFLQLCARLARPGGLVLLSTMNRTVSSYLQVIVIAEYVARFLPRGSHRWSKFIAPNEMNAAMAAAGANRVDLRGLTMNLRTWRLGWSRNTRVTYFAAYRMPSA